MLQVMTLTMADRCTTRREPAGGDVVAGRYELLDRLGRGGMSVVWRARDGLFDRLVALKVLAEPYAADRDLLQEARVTAMVSSPYVVRTFDYGENHPDSTLQFIVLELVDGITLQERLTAGSVPPAAAMRIAAQVASAVAAIHAAAVVHCDIKPANVMLTRNGVKIVDFGIATAARAEPAPSEPFRLLGTPAYLAPERITGNDVRAPADVYALGVLLYRLLADRPPWHVDTTTQMLVAHVSAPPEPMPARAGIPPFVTTLASRCLAKDPASRPTAREAELLLTRGARIVPAAARPATAATRNSTELQSRRGRRR